LESEKKVLIKSSNFENEKDFQCKNSLDISEFKNSFENVSYSDNSSIFDNDVLLPPPYLTYNSALPKTTLPSVYSLFHKLPSTPTYPISNSPYSFSILSSCVNENKENSDLYEGENVNHSFNSILDNGAKPELISNSSHEVHSEFLKSNLNSFQNFESMVRKDVQNIKKDNLENV
jgi:hypothetical protein